MPEITLVSRQGRIGFKKPLKFPVQKGSRISDILKNLNSFRSPDSQIETLFLKDGQKADRSMIPEDGTLLYVD